MDLVSYSSFIYWFINNTLSSA